MSDDTPRDDLTPDNVVRDTKGRFRPGSASPYRGGPISQTAHAFLSNKIDLTDLYKSKAVVVFTELVKLIEDPKTPATAKVSAIKEFNDRAVGRPNQAIKVSPSGEMESDTLDTGRLSTEVLREIELARLTTRKA